MENLHNAETRRVNRGEYPEKVNDTKSIINLQAPIWALIAVVLYIIYRHQPDKNSALGIVQLTIIAVSALMAIIKLFAGSHKLTYAPTGSPIAREERYYNLALEGDIRECLREGNISRLNALKTDDAGGIMVELLASRDKRFLAMRMQKYCPEGYRPETSWVTMD